MFVVLHTTMANESNGSGLAPTIAVHPAPHETLPQPSGSVKPQTTQQHLEPESSKSASNWPHNLIGYSPELFNGRHLLLALQTFENRFLSKETAVRLLEYRSNTPGAFEATLNAEQLRKTSQRQENATTQLLFINRFLIRDSNALLPKDQKGLRISGKAFRNLSEHLNCSPAFLSCLVGHGLPLALCFRGDITEGTHTVSDLWYTIPVRVSIPCTDQTISHTLTTAGSNQTDPSQYLHLASAKIDIRPSRIVVYSRFIIETSTTKVLCFDFQDGRWVDYADEPFIRAKETLKRAEFHGLCADKHFIHVLMHSSAIIWWQESLNAYNRQLIEHEKVLLRERQRNDNLQDSETIMQIDTALHTMTAHLRRYKAEVTTLEENLQSLSTTLVNLEGPSGITNRAALFNNKQKFDTMNIRVQGLVKFIAEIEMKAQTVAALMVIDHQIVDSSQSMRNIMKASQEEAKLSRFMAKQSQEIARDARKDSIYMKAASLIRSPNTHQRD
ncbi:hypothetical protein BCR34DRAFT_655466 [Clohesyomyces aquaticus]|uniref:Uncharacterized protein n=1 Tax=Clohesyomyces aquaticus TaxID=1231657 RepID=A0A1Y1ZIX5_9PLEO|nr:hypothetical protein BCR34DRAFT_655466 [Clohesyomyces aquaticus]